MSDIGSIKKENSSNIDNESFKDRINSFDEESENSSNYSIEKYEINKSLFKNNNSKK